MTSCLILYSSTFLLRGWNTSSAIAPAQRRSNSSSSDGVWSSSSTRVAVAASAGSPSGSPLTFGGARRISQQQQQQQQHASPLWGSFGSNSSPVVHHLCPCLRAKRKSQVGGDVSQEEEDLDEDLRVGLNEISTEALKAMLSEDDKVVATLRDKVESIEEYLGRQQQLDAARFMLVVKGMLDHEVITEKDDLKGAYKKAFDKIASVIEDSGWVLKQAGADIGGVEMVDDELMPPVLNSQY